MPELAAEVARFEQRRQQRAAELANRLAELERSMAEQSARLAAHTDQLDRAVARRDALLADVAARLAQQPGYAPLSEQATRAEVALGRDVARADELRAEAKAKLPPYEHSRLFQYLWRRAFGTADYGGRGFAARMDRRLARYIGYDRAAASYRFLTTTPRVVQLEVERRTAEVGELRQRLEAMEDAVEAELGVPDAQRAVDDGVAERERLVAAIAELQRELAATHAAVRDEAGSRGRFHAEAVHRLAALLASVEAAALERHARATPDPADDRLVAELRACTAEWTRADGEVEPLERRALERDRTADQLEELLVRFRRADFDAGRSEFADLDVGDLVDDVHGGRKTAADAWRELESHQRFREPPAVHHRQRSNDVLNGIGLAMQVAGVLANVALRSGRRSGGFSMGGGFGSSRGGGPFGGFSTGRSIGGGGGFSTGRRF
jgi:chromosome segregation ATPase